MLNPENVYLNKLELCEKAGVNRKVYYTAFSNPKFVALYRSKAKDLISEAVVPIINASVKEAIAGSFQHAKLLLEMGDMHQDSLAVTGDKKGAIITAEMSPKDAAALYAKKVKGEV